MLYDACVLYPAPLRDLLMHLALTDLFQARWTDRIHEEWTRSVLANRPDISAESLSRCRRLMDEHVPDCLVTGYEALIPTVALPDDDDCHVLSASIHVEASIIVTFNLTDFPAEALGPFDIEAVHPDVFVCRLFDEDGPAVLEAVRAHRAGLKRPPKTTAEYLATLEQCRLIETVLRLRAHEGDI